MNISTKSFLLTVISSMLYTTMLPVNGLSRQQQHDRQVRILHRRSLQQSTGISKPNLEDIRIKGKNGTVYGYTTQPALYDKNNPVIQESKRIPNQTVYLRYNKNGEQLKIRLA